MDYNEQNTQGELRSYYAYPPYVIVMPGQYQDQGQLLHSYNQYLAQPMCAGAINTGHGWTNIDSFDQIIARFSSIFEFDSGKPDYTLWGHGPVQATANHSHQNDGQGHVSGPSPSSSTDDQLETIVHPSFWSKPDYTLWGDCPVHPMANNSHQNDSGSGPSPSSSMVNGHGATVQPTDWSNPYYTLWGHGPVQPTANNISHPNDGQGYVSGATSSSSSVNQLGTTVNPIDGRPWDPCQVTPGNCYWGCHHFKAI